MQRKGEIRAEKSFEARVEEMNWKKVELDGMAAADDEEEKKPLK